MKVICKQSFSTIGDLSWIWLYFEENMSYNCDSSTTNYPYYQIYIQKENYNFLNHISLDYSDFKKYFYTEKDYRKHKLQKLNETR